MEGWGSSCSARRRSKQNVIIFFIVLPDAWIYEWYIMYEESECDIYWQTSIMGQNTSHKRTFGICQKKTKSAPPSPLLLISSYVFLKYNGIIYLSTAGYNPPKYDFIYWLTIVVFSGFGKLSFRRRYEDFLPPLFMKNVDMARMLMNRSKASLVDRIEWFDMKESTPCLMVRLVMMYTMSWYYELWSYEARECMLYESKYYASLYILYRNASFDGGYIMHCASIYSSMCVCIIFFQRGWVI